MADTKISALPSATTPTGTDVVSGVQSSATVKFTFSQVLSYIQSNISVNVAAGGTGITSYAVGDLIYASGATTLSKLAGVATGNVLLSGGVATAPSWGKVDLTAHVTGTLPVANGGTGITSLGTGIATFLGTPSSANLRAAITDETGSGGGLVFATSPTIATPSFTGRTVLQGAAFAVTTKTATYTATNSDHTILCNTTSGNITINLPAAASNSGLRYIIKKIAAANTVTIDPNGTETIDGSTTATLTGNNDTISIISDGTNWQRIAVISSSAGSGTVTSVDFSGGTTGLTTSGGPVTGSGTITLAGTLAAANGGTGQTSYTVGDLLYASTTTALSKLAAVATGNVLRSGGVGAAPAWGQVNLTTDVTGVLPHANGGTGKNTFREFMMFALSDETTAITTGTAKITFRMPYAFTITEVRASLSTASTSGNVVVDINENGTSIMTTNKLLIDANEKTSTTASTAATLTDTSIADDAEITMDIDTAGTGAKGLKVTIIGYRT